MGEGPSSSLDRLLTGAFGRHATAERHATMRKRYRATARASRFPLFLSRVYAASWLAFLLGAGLAVFLVGQVPQPVEAAILDGLAEIPLVRHPHVDRALGPAIVVAVGAIARWATFRGAAALLERRATRRRRRIERSLPRTVRFMHVLASGTTDVATLLGHVARRERAFGETARAFDRILGTRDVVGSVDGAIRVVARDTPSRRTLAPFLLTLRSRAREGPEAIARFLHLESRMLARRDAQRTETAKRYLGSVLRLFVVFLVVPVIAAIGIAVATGIGGWAPGTTSAVGRWIREQVVLSPASAVLVLALGGITTGLVYLLRPPGYRWSRYRSSTTLRTLLATSPRNPANALVVLGPVGGLLAAWAVTRGTPPSTAVTFGYVVVALPVGLVDWRRARIDAAKDRHLPELLHEIAHQIHLGRSFTEAVEHVAADQRLGPLDADVANLAFDLRVAKNDRPIRAAALDRFVERVGTPLAKRTVGMIAGALDAGSRTTAAFQALQSEAGRLYHEERAVRDEMPVVMAVGWAASLLVVGVVVAVNVAALGTTDPLGHSAAFGAAGGREPPAFYLLTQATVLSSGWFAGVAGRGVYEGLLHSGALLVVTSLAFAASGLL
ncbi:MAG: hypothetical protein ABEJ44_01170 [Halanaeroarchaeum sp.]